MHFLWNGFFNMVFYPGKTFQNMVLNEKIFLQSMIFFTSIGVVYLVIVFIWWRIGFYPWFPPLLKIKRENYYFAELFFQPPVTFLCFVMTAGIIRVMSELLGKQSSVPFYLLLSIIVYALFIPILIWLIHDGIYTILFLAKKLTIKQFHDSFKAKGKVFKINIAIIIMTALWHSFLIINAVQAVENMSIGHSITIGLTALFAFYGTWVFVFQR